MQPLKFLQNIKKCIFAYPEHPALPLPESTQMSTNQIVIADFSQLLPKTRSPPANYHMLVSASENTSRGTRGL